MPTTLRLHGYEATDIHKYIELLIHNLVNIKDTTGRFLLKLDDGRIIDTKGRPSHKLPMLREKHTDKLQDGMTGNGLTELVSTVYTNITP
jgi:hypothetical protein